MSSPLDEECYKILKKVPCGCVTTYGELAKALGVKSPRQIGRFMKLNPYAPEVPCHRVVCSDGKIGGYAYGVNKKIQILKTEGVDVVNDKIADFKQHLFCFNSLKNKAK